MRTRLISILSMLALLAVGCTQDSDSGNANNASGFIGCTPRTATGDTPMIDDLSDGDGTVLPNEGREGGWYVFNDGTGQQYPAASTETTAEGCAANPAEAPVTNGRACTSGSGFTAWGGAIGVAINNVACVSCAYDASVYGGVRFTLSGVVTGNLRFEIVTNDTLGVTWGGRCEDPSVCCDVHGIDVVATTDPTEYEVRFDELVQMGWGTPVVFDPTEITAFQWYVHLTGTEVAFQNLCIDDLSFF